MSRIPSGPPPNHYAQQPLPPPPQTHNFYANQPPGHLPPNIHPHALPPQGGAYPPPPPAGTANGNDPNVYPPYQRQHQHSMSGGGGWMGGPPPPSQGSGVVEGYHNAVAGPSRGGGGGDPYQAYAQPTQSHRSSPSQPISARQQQQQQQQQQQEQQPLATGAGVGVGWSSVQPGAPIGRGGVKLEDLVSNERRTHGSGQIPPSSSGGLPPIQSQAPIPQANGKTALSSIPLSVSHSYDQKMRRPSTASESAGAGTGSGGVAGAGNQQQGPSEFIKKLYKMLEEESAQYGKGVPAGKRRGEGAKRGSVGWGQGGASFVVWDMNDFTTKVLPQTFRHSNFSSFVRQLNKYGFSKIKHVDEETGTIKENVWEFQHPSFQAGGKADLENIKRKPVGPKKGGGGENEESSPKGTGLSGEDMSRMNLMEHRIGRLEDDLVSAIREVREARARESGLMGLMRDLISHVAAKANGSTTGDGNSPRVLHLLQSFDQIAQGIPMSRPATANPQGGVSFATPMQPSMGHTFNNAGNYPPTFSNGSTLAQTSPRTDGTGSRGSISVPSPTDGKPSGLRNVSGPSSGLTASSSAPQDQNDDIIELPSQMQTLYEGGPVGVTPVFADTPAWLTEGTTVPLPIYHRKSSDGVALRLMYEANGTAPTARVGEIIPETMDGASALQEQAQQSGTMPTQGGPLADQSQIPNLQHTSFGIVIPPTVSNPSLKKAGPPRPKKASTSTGDHDKEKESKLVPHWAQKPKILIVEDDVVYRQLSRKFLQKFGCETESVENAQGAVDKMNRTKYDLVLMDIFFGPNMDGRKATSLIRQFDNYTPIISMTSNAQPQDVDSYFQSGMNDILAKPFTKHHLFCILDKHLIHLRHAQLYEKLIPVGVGLPPLSDQHVEEALAVTAANIQETGVIPAAGGELEGFRNPLAGTGWSDETYQLVLQQFLATGTMPDVSTISNGAIGTSVVFGSSATFTNDRKRSIEAINDDEWDPTATANPNGNGNGTVDGNQGLVGMGGPSMGGVDMGAAGGDGRELKRARGLVG
nr:uncharacterized protein CI109_000642 [Kwoniella shandongensis]KAA5531070.1 hypothetical protein CI109_000642 [Kwoniella shandongensis]